MEEKKSKLMIPISRVNTIMKSSSDVEIVSKESSILMSKAAEMFLKRLTQQSYDESNHGKRLDYKHLSSVVHANEKYSFLRDIVPKKITVLQFKELMAKKQAAQKNETDEDSSSDSGSSSSGSSSSSSDSEN